MLQMNNTSPFEVEMFGFPDREGVDTMYVVVKATFELGERGLLVAQEQQPVTLVDEYWGEPGESSLRYASEAHLSKPGTDVIVVGEACAPGERPVDRVDVSVAVAGRRKDARVHGERYWTEGVGGLRPSRAKPFVRMPVIYERTFGGKHVPDPDKAVYLAEHRNPVGCGFLGKRSVKEILGTPAPNIEDPRSPVGAPGSRGTPVGFGAIAPSWRPRMDYAGTYDEAWQETRAPYLPRDFDPRFFNIAPEEFVFPQNLVGGESVALLGFHPGGLMRFSLPRCEIGMVLIVAGQPEPLAHKLETVLLEPTAERFCLSWRASMPVDKKLLRVEEIKVSLDHVDGAELRRGA